MGKGWASAGQKSGSQLVGGAQSSKQHRSSKAWRLDDWQAEVYGYWELNPSNMTIISYQFVRSRYRLSSLVMLVRRGGDQVSIYNWHQGRST
jgi:hypothetical protein